MAMLAVLAVGGLVIDATRQLAALRATANVAADAARIGGQHIDVSARRSGIVALDPDAATASAYDHIGASGMSGTVSVAGDTITVTVSHTVSPVALPIGASTVSATRTASANVEEGAGP